MVKEIYPSIVCDYCNLSCYGILNGIHDYDCKQRNCEQSFRDFLSNDTSKRDKYFEYLNQYQLIGKDE